MALALFLLITCFKLLNLALSYPAAKKHNAFAVAISYKTAMSYIATKELWCSCLGNWP